MRMRAFKLVFWIVFATLPCFGGEVAVLRNGFSIRHERREVIGETTRLYVTADGSSFVDVATAEIEHFEAAPDLPASDSGLPASGTQANPHFSQTTREMGHPPRRCFLEHVRWI